MRILVIDDSQLFMQLAIRIIQMAIPDSTIDTANSMSDAARLTLKQNYELIISDYNLEDGNGIQILTAIRDGVTLVDSATPIILLTGEETLPISGKGEHKFHLINKSAVQKELPVLLRSISIPATNDIL